jgi:hypothetical protein
MNARCKVNDLAIIIQSEISENIGRIVHIDRPFDQAFDGAFRWVASSTGAPMLGCFNGSGVLVETLVGVIEDYMLRPITGLPIDEEITDEVTA